MAIKINFDSACIPEKPTLILATRSGNFLGQLLAEEIVVHDAMNESPEISFSVKKYKDNNSMDYLWDSIQDFKLVWCKEWDMWFEIAVELEESNSVQKKVSATNLGIAELSQLMVYTTEINTENDIARDDYELPTVFYNEKNSSISLLNRVMEKAYAYSIEHVDDSLKNIQRTFSFDGKSIYDCLQEIAEEIGCLFVFNSNTNKDGSINRSISVYDLEQICNDCGYRGEFTNKCPKCNSTNFKEGYGEDTCIFIESNELTEDIQLKTDSESTKTCFKLEAGDDLMTATIINCNPGGSSYLWRIPEYMMQDMSEELQDKIKEYNNLYNMYSTIYPFAYMNIDKEKIDYYNSLIDYYKSYNKNLEKLVIPVSGYPALIKNYYNTIDFCSFLKTELMPSVEMIETNAIEQMGILLSKMESTISVSSLSSVSKIAVENSIESMAKSIIDNRYKMKVTESNCSDENGEWKWSGKFYIENNYDETDNSTSDSITLDINDNYEDYVKQKVDNALNKSVNYNSNIKEIFSLNDADFESEIRKYCYDYLKIFKDSCTACIDILIQQGVSDKNGSYWDSEENSLYESLYLPYCKKNEIIDSVLNEMDSNIKMISGDPEDPEKERSIQYSIEKIIASVHNSLNLEAFLGEGLLKEFSCYRREDEYKNDNYISEGLTTSELFENANKFIEVAQKEIYKASEKQYSIVSTLKNILLIDKFKPLVDSFKVGNWIRYRVDGSIFKLRLIGYEIDYDNLNEIDLELSNVLKIADGVSDQQSIMKQISTMATSYKSVQRQASKGEDGDNKINQIITDGVYLDNIKLLSESKDQAITLDKNGLLCRQVQDDNTYDDAQLKIINNGIYMTDDNWETAKTAIGYCNYKNADGTVNYYYGINAETIVGKLVIGEQLNMYNKDNSFMFNKDGLSVFSKDVSVIINPNAESIFTIKSNGENTFSFDSKGNLIVVGEIHATGFYLKDGVTISHENISGLSTVAITGEYSDLSGTPELHKVAISGEYEDLNNKPNLSAVAESGDYNDLSNLPDLNAKFDNPSNNNSATNKSILRKVGNYSEWESVSNSIDNSDKIPNSKAVYDYALSKNVGAQKAGKLLYVDVNGNIITLSIEDLKNMLQA